MNMDIRLLGSFAVVGIWLTSFCAVANEPYSCELTGTYERPIMLVL